MDEKLLFDLSYGLYIVSAIDGNKNVGCIINTCFQITSSPVIIAISLNKESYTCKVIKETQKFSINILSENINPELIGTFGYQSSKDIDKYQSIHYKMVDNLPMILERCCGTLFLNVINIVDLGTHFVFFASMENAIKNESLPPMTYGYYHEVIKGKASSNKISYICDVCGFIYEGDISKEPDDYVCPICKVSKDHFKLIT